MLKNIIKKQFVFFLIPGGARSLQQRCADPTTAVRRPYNSGSPNLQQRYADPSWEGDGGRGGTRSKKTIFSSFARKMRKTYFSLTSRGKSRNIRNEFFLIFRGQIAKTRNTYFVVFREFAAKHEEQMLHLVFEERSWKRRNTYFFRTVGYFGAWEGCFRAWPAHQSNPRGFVCWAPK